MKRSIVFTLLTTFGITALISCSNNSETAAADQDSTTVPSSNTSSGDYAAYGDRIEQNSAKGYYVNPKTGKAYGSLHVNRYTGEITDENDEPVWRYVDTRNWWVYGVDDDWSWRKIGEAKMDNGQLVYLNDSGDWVGYDEMWKVKDDSIDKEWKMKSGDTKIKFDEDGDMKFKDDSSTIKYDAGDDELQVDSSK